MKIVVVGGTGLIGSRLVQRLREQGQDAIAASPKSGVNSITGEGLANALKGASAVVDVTNSPSWEDAAVMNFFESSTRNLLDHEKRLGIGHHIALSVVGTDRLQESGFFRAKMAQEGLIHASAVPWTLVRATQFFEFVKGIADFSTEKNQVRLPPAMFQPMAADDVAAALAKVAMSPPMERMMEIAGPEAFPLDELVRRDLAARNDARQVISDPHARYFGIAVSERTLLPDKGAQLGSTRFDDWIRHSVMPTQKKGQHAAA